MVLTMKIGMNKIHLRPLRDQKKISMISSRGVYSQDYGKLCILSSCHDSGYTQMCVHQHSHSEAEIVPHSWCARVSSEQARRV